MAAPPRRGEAIESMDKRCIKDAIEFFFTKLPSLTETTKTADVQLESAIKGLVRLCSDAHSAKAVILNLLEMGQSLQLANFGDTYTKMSRQVMETNRHVLEALKKCIQEIQRNFPSTAEKPSLFMQDDALVTKLFEHLDHHYMAPFVDVSHEGDRLQLIAGSAMRILTTMNWTLALSYLLNVLKNTNKFHSLTIVGYYDVTTKDLPFFLTKIKESPAISSNRSCKALCRGLQLCIAEWCKNNPDDFYELWQRDCERPDLISIRELSVELFCAIASHVNKDKRRCAMWPCMGMLLRLCSTRIKPSLETLLMKKGLFSGLSDDLYSKFARRFERLVTELNVSSYASPEQKSHFLVSLQVLRDALEAIALLSTHARSPHLRPASTSSAVVHFNEELGQLWKLFGSTDAGGEKKPNLVICFELLLDPNRMWLADFSSKSEMAHSVGVLVYEKDVKSRVAKLAYDLMLFACRLKKTPNALLQSHNPFNIRKIWEMVVAQKCKNYYFTVFIVRVIREVIQECAAAHDLESSQHRASPRVSAMQIEASSSQSAIKSSSVPNQKTVYFLPGSPVIDMAAQIMDCTLTDLSMYMIDVVRQTIYSHYEILTTALPAAASATAPGHLKASATSRTFQTVVLYCAKQVLKMFAEAPHLGFIPVVNLDSDAVGWPPLKAKQMFREVDKSPNGNYYKAIITSLETGPARWVSDKPYSAVYTVLMCFVSVDLMLEDPDRDLDKKSSPMDAIDAISSMFSVRTMPMFYPESQLVGVLTVFGVICAAASEQILVLIKDRQPYRFAQKGLQLLKHSCLQLLQFLSQNPSSLQLDDPTVNVLRPRLSVESSAGDWVGHRVEFMIFIAACEFHPSFLAELYSFTGAFCDVLSVFHSNEHPHFVLFQSLSLGTSDLASFESLHGAAISGKTLTNRIHNALRDATFQISRNTFSLNIWQYLFSTWANYVQLLMAADKAQRTILVEDEYRLESYASFLLLLSPALWAPGISSSSGQMSSVFNVFLEFFNKKLSEHIDDFFVDERADDRLVDFSRHYFKKFLSKSFPSMFCEELFSCMVSYSKEYTKELQRLCKKHNAPEHANELIAKYCLPLYCDVLLEVLSSLSDSLSQKCLNNLKELSLIIVCNWVNNPKKAHDDVYIQRLQLICQVVSAMAKVRSWLPFANGYGFWSLWLQQTYDWAVRLSTLSNEQSSSSRVEIFNAINLLLQVVPENKLEEKDARASDKKYLKFILNELEKQTTVAKAHAVSKSGAFINDDIQSALMDGLAAVIKKSKFSVGLDPCLKFVTDLRFVSQQRREHSEPDASSIVALTKAIFSLKVLQNALLPRKDSQLGSAYSEAAGLQIKFSHIINLIFEAPNFFIVHGMSRVADAAELEMLSMIFTKVALSRDQIADLLISVVSADLQTTLTPQTIGRSNTIATKVSMCTIRFLQEPFLSSCLTSFALRLSKMPRYSLLVEQGSEASFIESSVAGHALDGLLASIETTLSRMHPAIVLVCRVWYNATKKKFPGSELAAVGGIFFLRFMCPVITILAASDQTDAAYQNSFIKHKQLIQLVAKILLGICNQISSFKEASMKRYESHLTSSSARITAIYLRLAGDSTLVSAPEDSDAAAQAMSSRFSSTISPGDLSLEVTDFNSLHRFLHSKLDQIETATESCKFASFLENLAPASSSSDITDLPTQKGKSLSAKELQAPPSSFAEAVRKIGEPTIIKSAQVVSQKMQLEKIQEWVSASETDMSDYDFNRLLISDASKTKDGCNHRLYYIFRERSEVPDDGSKREERLERSLLKTLLPLMKNGVKIDLIIDFTKSNYQQWFSPAEINFYKSMIPPEFADNFVNILIVSPGQNTELFCDLFKGRSMFASHTNFVVLDSPLSIFDHIPQADCLLPQESFGIENDVLGDDETCIYTFNDINCQTPNFGGLTSSISIKIGTKFLHISRQKLLKLPEKRRAKASHEGGGHAQQSDDAHGAQTALHTLNDAIPRTTGTNFYIFQKTGSHELRLETKKWLNKNIKLKCDGAQASLLVDAEMATQKMDSELLTQGALYSGLSPEEYLSRILVVSLMGLCDTDDSVRTESQCLLSRIFRRLGSGPAFEHTMFSCPPSNMNRLTTEISARIVASNPRLALPFLESSLSVVIAFNSSSSHKPPVNLQYLLLEIWTPWLQCVMQDAADASRIKAVNYAIDSLKDERITERWGSYKILELEIKLFEKKLNEIGENVLTFVVQSLKEDDLLYYIILNRIWPMLNSDENLSRHLLQYAFSIKVSDLQKNRLHELLVYIGFQWPQSAGRELMSRIKSITERQFYVAENSTNDEKAALMREQADMMEWLQDIYAVAEVLKLISFESISILKGNFGQLLHLYCLFLSIIPFDSTSAMLVHNIQKFIHTSILNSAALLDIAAKSVSHKITHESVVLGEASASLDDSGRPLVDVIVGILRNSCNYSDFNLSNTDNEPKFVSASPVSRIERRGSAESVSSQFHSLSADFDSVASPLPKKEISVQTRVMFSPSLVGRLGSVARKLLEVVDIIQKSSSYELAEFTEQWKVQWHVEAYMFISNRTERRDTKTFYSLAACNSIYYVVVGDVLRPAPSSPRDHDQLFIEMLRWFSEIIYDFESRKRIPERTPTAVVHDVQCDFMASWEGHDQQVTEKQDLFPDPRLLVAHSIIAGMTTMMGRFKDCEPKDILALASLAMALLPFGYQKSVAGPREGITTTIGFQMLAAVLSIRVRKCDDEPSGRLENRIVDWMSSLDQHAQPTSRGSATAIHKSALSSEPCEMLAMVFMFRALPVLISPDTSNTLIIPAIRSVRPYLLQYYDSCAAVGHSRTSAGSTSKLAGEGSDALYLCLLSLLFQPGDINLHQRLNSDCIADTQSADAPEAAGDSSTGKVVATPVKHPVEEVVMMLLSKLEPSGILDRWPALSCALFIRIFDALIISSQAIPLEQKESDMSFYSIPKTKPTGPAFAAAAAAERQGAGVAATASVGTGGGSKFIPEYETGLCIILRLLARFVEVAHKTASEVTSALQTQSLHADEPVSVAGAELGMAHAMQGYGSWLLYRASQLYCNCNVPQVKEAACSLMLNTILLVRLVSEGKQEAIRKSHSEQIDVLRRTMQPMSLFDVRLYTWQGEQCMSYNELQATQGGGKSVIEELKISVALCMQALESQGSAAPPVSP